MQNDQLEKHINSAIAGLTPDIFEKVNSVPVEKLNEMNFEDVTKKSRGTLKSKWKYTMATVCAACLLFVIGINFMNSRIATTIDIDVNPSIEITANSKDRVINVTPLNTDGKLIIDGMDLRKTDLDVAVNAIIGSMVKNGYISEVENAILISVNNKDKAKADKIRTNLTEDISLSLKQSNIKAAIYNQEITEDKSLKEISNKYCISTGKAAFLQKLLEKTNDFTYEMLVPMSIEEIAELISQNNINLQGIIDYEEDESVEENIEEAIEDLEEGDDSCEDDDNDDNEWDEDEDDD